MKPLFIFAFLAMAACTSHHPDTYVYREQVYVTNQASEFEVDHFVTYATRQFVVLDAGKEGDEAKRVKKVDYLCRSKVLDCPKIKLSRENKNLGTEIMAIHKAQGGEKYLLFSGGAETSAVYLGLVHLLVDQGDEKSLEAVLKDLSVADVKGLSETLLSIQSANQ